MRFANDLRVRFRRVLCVEFDSTSRLQTVSFDGYASMVVNLSTQMKAIISIAAGGQLTGLACGSGLS